MKNPCGYKYQDKKSTGPGYQGPGRSLWHQRNLQARRWQRDSGNHLSAQPGGKQQLHHGVCGLLVQLHPTSVAYMDLRPHEQSE